MIGMFAEIGVPFWPWQVPHTCAFAATSSSARAGAATQAMATTVDKTTKAIANWRLNIVPAPYACSQSLGEAAATLDALLQAQGCQGRRRCARPKLGKGGQNWQWLR